MEMIHIFGTDKIFFGSDHPMWNVKKELETFMSLPLSDEDREKILHKTLKDCLQAVNESSQTVLFGKDENGIYCGRGEEGMLTRSGDDLRIDWGWLHLAAPDHQYVIVNTKDKKKISHKFLKAYD